MNSHQINSYGTSLASLPSLFKFENNEDDLPLGYLYNFRSSVMMTSVIGRSGIQVLYFINFGGSFFVSSKGFGTLERQLKRIW